MTPVAGKYRCISIDAPWPEYGGGGRGAQNHYDLLHTSEIAKVILRGPFLPLPDCHLWMWATDNYLRDAFAMIDRFGFRYVRTFAWIKSNTEELEDIVDEVQLEQGLGQYARGSHELCLFSVRGRSMVPAAAMRPKSVIVAPTDKVHSRKPEKAFVRWFEKVSPGPRLEMFARSPRAGWDVWGNEVDRFSVAKTTNQRSVNRET